MCSSSGLHPKILFDPDKNGFLKFNTFQDHARQPFLDASGPMQLRQESRSRSQITGQRQWGWVASLNANGLFPVGIIVSLRDDDLVNLQF
jgi:hypothetical protein